MSEEIRGTLIRPARMDELGRVVIPKRIRKMIGMVEGSQVDIYLNGETVIIAKSEGQHKLMQALNEAQGQAELLASIGDDRGAAIGSQLLEQISVMREIIGDYIPS